MVFTAKVIFNDENDKDVSLLLFYDKFKLLLPIYEQENSLDNISCSPIMICGWRSS